MSARRGRTTVVIATRDRHDELLETLHRIEALPERPPVIVVDNGSTDGSASAVRRRLPAVRVVELGDNLGAGARNVGARLAATPYVAFNDDDSWWDAGALAEAERMLDESPRLALVAARILVEPGGRLDPVCRAMADSPLPRPAGAGGPSVLGFVACGAVLRRAALLGVGGFEQRMGIGGEEELLSLDLTTAGWQQVYADRVVAHHRPQGGRRPGRTRNVVRNQLLVAWLRRPLTGALRATARVLVRNRGDHGAARGVVDALREAPWVARERDPVRPSVERRLRVLD